MPDYDLARRAIARTGWRAMMSAFDAGGRRFRVLAMFPDGGALATLGGPGACTLMMSCEAMALCVPDLGDPCTLGVFLALYDAGRKTKACPDPVYTAAAVYGLMSHGMAAALVAALEGGAP